MENSTPTSFESSLVRGGAISREFVKRKLNEDFEQEEEMVTGYSWKTLTVEEFKEELFGPRITSTPKKAGEEEEEDEEEDEEEVKEEVVERPIYIVVGNPADKEGEEDSIVEESSN